MGHDDDVALPQLLGAVHEFVVGVEVQELVRLGQREGVVELHLLVDMDAKGLEPLLLGSIEYLQ